MNVFSGAEIFNPPDQFWLAVPFEGMRRGGHTAILLRNRKVLVAGGVTSLERSSAAYLYDYTNRSWETTGTMVSRRSDHAAVMLKDGRVLVAGGCVKDTQRNDVVAVAGSEIYDPNSGKWTATGSLNVARYYHKMVLLTDGRVLAVGGVPRGVSAASIPECEIFDPETNAWIRAGSMVTARRTQFTLTALPGGRALAVGGGVSWTKRATSGAEIYDAASDRWTAVDSMPATRSGHSALLLRDNNVLILGGREHQADHSDGPFSSTALVFDQVRLKWKVSRAPVGMKVDDGQIVLLRDGRIFFTGGFDGRDAVMNSAIIEWSEEDETSPAAADGAAAGGVAAYPNPFSISKDGEMFINNVSAYSSLKIYSADGALVQELADDDGDGLIRWNGNNLSGVPVAEGAYYAVLRNSAASSNIKITVLK